jgi:glutaredoxin 1
MIAEVVVFSREGCGFCVKAKDLLLKKKLAHSIVSLEDDYGSNKFDFRAAIEDRIPSGTEFSTLPQIFIGEQYVGGYTELVKIIGE